MIRESGGDRSAVTGGTRVLSDQIKVKITSNPGETFLDRMIALVEGAERQKTPNEIALNILLAGLTIIFFGGRDTSAVCNLLRFSADRVCVGFFARLLDSDDDWWSALGYRHCRHGSPGATQCACDVRPCRRSCRRRKYALAGQDWNHHTRQSPGIIALFQRLESLRRSWPTQRSFHL